MTYHNPKLRSATTAIAAVLAISSTPLFAQDALAPDPAPETVSEPVSATPDPLAPEPATTETPAVTKPPSQTPKASKPVAKAAHAEAHAPTSPTTITRSSTTTAPVATAAPVVAEPVAAPDAPPVEATAPPALAPQPVDTTSLADAQQRDALLEVAGAGLLALLLGGMALRSRKRRKEEQRAEVAKWAYIEDHPAAGAETVREPSITRAPTPIHDPAPALATSTAGAPVTTLPNGFDLSRFGPHVQAAYRGPTPDNPSLSLKYRLRRASALDLQERRAMAQPATRPASPAPAQPAWGPREGPQFMLRRAETSRAEANNGAKPAFQR
jgi:hypothetical protein